ncbi:mycofactocin biosynthesis chaperone MftB [Patulibacter minatonensis]|uniref:mycofactocin biosynthesis chaperone MftB n=1 Tax=Patulibacter minatonensis TaxID=298163 RepID=UPI00047960B2|nr:mycofactocin biosynthesis chaperone MftB [Patulibacter minatonensis]
MSTPTTAPAPADATTQAGAADWAGGHEFSLDAAWTLNPQVALRPERFGALAYHFGTRRLSFLKSPHLLTVVERLADHPTARAACLDAGLDAAQTATFGKALATLARTDMIVPRNPA